MDLSEQQILDCTTVSDAGNKKKVPRRRYGVLVLSFALKSRNDRCCSCSCCCLPAAADQLTDPAIPFLGTTIPDAGLQRRPAFGKETVSSVHMYVSHRFLKRGEGSSKMKKDICRVFFTLFLSPASTVFVPQSTVFCSSGRFPVHA